MVAQVDPFVDRAKIFLRSGKHADLCHAALELRLAIEEIAIPLYASTIRGARINFFTLI